MSSVGDRLLLGTEYDRQHFRAIKLRRQGGLKPYAKGLSLTRIREMEQEMADLLRLGEVSRASYLADILYDGRRSIVRILRDRGYE